MAILLISPRILPDSINLEGFFVLFFAWGILKISYIIIKKKNYIDVYNILISIATILLESSLSMEQSRLGAVFKLLNSYV